MYYDQLTTQLPSHWNGEVNVFIITGKKVIYNHWLFLSTVQLSVTTNTCLRCTLYYYRPMPFTNCSFQYHSLLNFYS